MYEGLEYPYNSVYIKQHAKFCSCNGAENDKKNSYLDIIHMSKRNCVENRHVPLFSF